MAAKAKPSQRTARRVRATQRTTARRKSGAFNFDAGKTGRRLKAIPATTTAINTMIRQYGKTVVARSRYLATNNPYAAAAKDAFVSALVGTGIKPSSIVKDADLKAAIQQAWADWTDEADADALTDFYGMQGIVAGEMFEAGECFVRLRKRRPEDGLTVPLQLQLIPSEMCPVEMNEIKGTNRIECGIEFDAIGRRVAYWFYRQHPGELGSPRRFFTGAQDRVRVPADEVLHLFEPIRAGQIRGVPHTLAGIVTLAMIDLYDDAELERKRLAALFGAFITRNGSEGEDFDPFEGSTKTEGETKNTSLEPGVTIELDPGQDVKFAEPADVGSTYEAFQYRNLLRAAAGFGVTYSDMTGDLRQTSYGSIRAGLVSFRRRIEKKQHAVMVYQFNRPIWRAWFDAAVLVGAIESEGVMMLTPSEYLAAPKSFNRAKHIPPKWEWVDPLKDRQAEKLAVDSGFKPRSSVIEAEGYDPEDVDAQIAADQERASNYEIKFITLGSSIVVAPDIDSAAPSDEEPETPDIPGQNPFASGD